VASATHSFASHSSLIRLVALGVCRRAPTPSRRWAAALLSSRVAGDDDHRLLLGHTRPALGLCSSVSSSSRMCARARDALGRLVELAQAEVSRLLFMTCRRPSRALVPVEVEHSESKASRAQVHSSRCEVGVACGGCAWPPRGRPSRAWRRPLWKSTCSASSSTSSAAWVRAWRPAGGSTQVLLRASLGHAVKGASERSRLLAHRGSRRAVLRTQK